MPLGFERINERSQRPNANINFIKILPSASTADQKIAQDFLERIAAQCFPIMKKHYLYVMALEEFPANNEFLGRNFNAGEVIQLVLKDKAGRWLSFKFVQMVMMHELAHCKQMNHSKFFWKERNLYAENMKELWQKGYTGEGLWGRGKDLLTGRLVHDHMPDQAEIPEHLCGGTYRRNRGKRKRGQEDDKTSLSYAERQQKRIAKKFGKHGDGNALGEDDLVRGALEQGKRHAGKPRVAQSKRGRELRANAALARFEAAKSQSAESNSERGDESDTDWSGDEDIKFIEKEDIAGNDSGMIQVCGDEGEQTEGGQDEMNELRVMNAGNEKKEEVGSKSLIKDMLAPTATPQIKLEDDENDSETVSEVSVQEPKMTCAIEEAETESEAESDKAVLKPPVAHIIKSEEEEIPLCAGGNTTSIDEPAPTSKPSLTACPICSLENEPDSVICIACSHVLKPSLMRNHWRCKSEACKNTKYINPGDNGRCGLCGAQKPTATSSRPSELLDPIC